ncbi:MAG: AAA family ATPase [Anaerolineaceae bacterium]|nr:AAA family ATPase [Anaerolineaceae bacterium]
MTDPTVSDPKVTVMLAGPGNEAVFYQMQPPFLSDARFSISATATQWAIFEQNLSQMRPDLVVVQVEIAPGPEALIQRLAEIQVWQGVAILVLPPAVRDLRGTFEKAAMVRGVYIAPVNWGDIAQAGFAAAMTERARLAAAAPLQQAYLSRTTTALTGTRVIAFLSATGGTGRSTIAESLAYELKFRRNTRTLLMSFDLPPAAVSHLRLRYVPNAMEYFARPGDGFAAAIQSREDLDVILAPENSVDYQRAAEISTAHKSDPASIYSLVMSSWTRNYGAVLLDLPAGEQPWGMQGIAAANTAIIISRCTLADMTATRHSLVLLLERLIGEHRIPREAIHLVLNQVSEHSTISPREFHDELSNGYGWAPPVAAVIPYLPAISQAQDNQIPAVTRVDVLAKAMHNLAEPLYPGSAPGENGSNGHNGKSRLRIPHFRFT